MGTEFREKTKLNEAVAVFNVNLAVFGTQSGVIR